MPAPRPLPPALQRGEVRRPRRPARRERRIARRRDRSGGPRRGWRRWRCR
jgi:hypothetical protein